MDQGNVALDRRSDGVLVALGLLSLVFGFSFFLSWKSNQISMSNPVWFVGMLIILGAALALIAIVFKWLGLASDKEAFGLPNGSVRTLLAVAVMVLFAVFGLAAISNDQSATPHISGDAMSETPKVASAKLEAEIARYRTMNIGAVVDSMDAANVATLSLYRLDSARPAETVDLMKQIITALVTLVTSVVSFYFGSRSAESAASNLAKADAPTGLTQTQQSDLADVDNSIKDIDSRLTALHKETASAGNSDTLLSNLSQADVALADCKSQRAKLDKNVQDLATGNASSDAVAAALGALKQSVTALGGLVDTGEGLVAKG